MDLFFSEKKRKIGAGFSEKKRKIVAMQMQTLDLTPFEFTAADPWPRGEAIVRDLARAVRAGGGSQGAKTLW